MVLRSLIYYDTSADQNDQNNLHFITKRHRFLNLAFLEDRKIFFFENKCFRFLSAQQFDLDMLLVHKYLFYVEKKSFRTDLNQEITSLVFGMTT